MLLTNIHCVYILQHIHHYVYVIHVVFQKMDVLVNTVCCKSKLLES
jgi:hypothetical protein